jgi:hypothetical protein
MTGEAPSPPNAAQQVIYDALQVAVRDVGLRVHRPPGLAGAYLSGQRVHAYVISRGGTYQVDLWRHNGRDPYRSTVCANLAAAVDAALAAAATR